MHAHIRRRNAFTLLELLVVVSLIVLVMALLLPAMTRVRNVAREVNSMSSVRQMLTGYRLYQLDHGGRVMFGYPPVSVDGVQTRARSASGHEFGFPVASRYPWRLAPYVAEVWEVIHTHVPEPQSPEPGDSDSEAHGKAYSLSIGPTYGLNSTYLGGHAGPSKGFVPQGTTDTPNDDAHVVFRASEVNRPSQLIVFTDAQQALAGWLFEGTGWFQATPPRAAGVKWESNGDHGFTLYGYQNAGIPKGRYSDKAVTGYFDGHVFAQTPEELDDMRLWANWADEWDYDFVQ